jgi:hypothetical protein
MFFRKNEAFMTEKMIELKILLKQSNIAVSLPIRVAVENFK